MSCENYNISFKEKVSNLIF